MRKYNPLPDAHPLIGEQCAACHEGFAPGHTVTLMTVGPGGDPEAQRKARDGQPYNAAAVPVHWSCATGENDA